MSLPRLIIALLVPACLMLAPRAARGDDATGMELFEKKIRPVLVGQCYECHSTASAALKGGLLLDSRDSIRRGGDSGPAVVPGDVAGSLLVSALRHDAFEMPPAGKLPDSVIADFERWIELGAPDPRDAPPDAATLAREVWQGQYNERRHWWCFQPPVDAPPPTVQDPSWSAEPLDRFIMARLEAAGLTPATPADRQTLARRLSFALTGLPPTSDDIAAALADPSPAGWAAFVDRKLASPHFGERWARHWMDVVRYTDTYGYEWDVPAKGAWRYRDYLIRAFNQDVPFDQLAREQIAGDLLPQPRINAQLGINESLIGPMFFQLGEKRHGDSSEFDGIHQEMLDNKIDAFSKAFQGLTVSCARCHDHKLDAIAQSEYYALAGAFMSSRWVTNTLDLPQRNAELFARLKEIKARLRPLLAQQWRLDAVRLADDLLASGEAPASPEVPANGAQAAGVASTASVWKSLTDARLNADPPLEDPLHAWIQVVKADRAGSHVAAVWEAVAANYRQQTDTRKQENAVHFLPVADFRQGLPGGWSIDGIGLRDIVACGDYTVVLEGERAIGRLLPGGLFTNVLSPRMNGALRTPHLNRSAEHGHISFECCGGDFAAHRTVIDNAFLTEKQVYLDNSEPAWKLLWTMSNMPERHVYLEFATKTSNPNFPPRVGLGGACSEEQAADPRSWFGVTRAVLHNVPRVPADELTRFQSLFDGSSNPPVGAAATQSPPSTLAEAATRYQAWFDRAIAAWQADQATEDDVRLVNWLLDQGLLANSSAANSADGGEIARLVSDYRAVEAQLAEPATVNGMADIDQGFDYPLNIRGEYDQLAAPVPRGYLQVLCPSATAFASSHSGRLELAELVARPDNPLTARVYVNRVWQWLFGAGLVQSPDNFGLLGGEPSHPELLDWLASWFVEEGWSTKALVRRIVLSQTWQQSGAASPQALSVDPTNRLLHHVALRRLEAEEIRDAILAASGRLDARLFGPPINPHRASEDPQKRLFRGPIDGDGRRSLYTKITIMEPPRFLALFNQPEPKIPTGKRDVSNTPAQSLMLLNDAFVTGQAEHWGRRLVERSGDTVESRIAALFQGALGRPPAADETARWAAAVADLAALHQTPESDMLLSVALWRDIAHAMFNLKEFIYVQ
jgi:hypothetical protein